MLLLSMTRARITAPLRSLNAGRACVQGAVEEDPDVPRPAATRGSGRLWIIVFALACLIGLGAWIAHGRQGRVQPAKPAPTAGGQQPRPVPVVVAPVRTGDLSVYLTALGS